MENLVKRANQILGTTNKTLADLLGAGKSTVDGWSFSGKIPKSGEAAINLLLELHELKSLTNMAEIEDTREKLKALEKLADIEKFAEVEQENEKLRREIKELKQRIKEASKILDPKY